MTTATTQRRQLTDIRDIATSAVHGNETAYQRLYEIGIGSLSHQQAEGLLLGLNFALSNLQLADD